MSVLMNAICKFNGYCAQLQASGAYHFLSFFLFNSHQPSITLFTKADLTHKELDNHLYLQNDLELQPYNLDSTDSPELTDLFHEIDVEDDSIEDCISSHSSSNTSLSKVSIIGTLLV